MDPLVSLMKVEKVPDSTYDMIGGLEKQIREIKEVIELPIKHPELFESLGVAQASGLVAKMKRNICSNRGLLCAVVFELGEISFCIELSLLFCS